MKRIFFILALLMMSGCAPIKFEQAIHTTPVTLPAAITYIVPSDEALVRRQGLIEDLVFPTISKYGYGTQTQEKSKLLGNYTVTRYNGDALDTIFPKRISDNSMIVERRLQDTTNAAFFSGKRYYVNFTEAKTQNGYSVTLEPTKLETYQAKIIFPLPVPIFNESDLHRYLLATEIYYRYEVNSQFSSESLYANFARLLKTSPFAEGEKDPVTGKIFKQQFILPYRDQEVFFTLETFPYRNGSKAVMYLRIPATLTSPNTVDYKIMLDDIKAALNKIVQS